MPRPCSQLSNQQYHLCGMQLFAGQLCSTDLQPALQETSSQETSKNREHHCELYVYTYAEVEQGEKKKIVQFSHGAKPEAGISPLTPPFLESVKRWELFPSDGFKLPWLVIWAR